MTLFLIRKRGRVVSTVEIDCLCSLFRHRTQENYRLLSKLSSYWHGHHCFKGIFKVDNFFLEHEVMWLKCKAVSTDDARAMVRVRNKVVALIKQVVVVVVVVVLPDPFLGMGARINFAES